MTLRPDFYIRNRSQLLSNLKGGFVVLGAHTQMQAVGDAAARFQQEANFWYLTGIREPDWQLIIDGSRGKSWLVAPALDDVRAVFEGSLSYEMAKEISGVDAVVSYDEADDLLRRSAVKHSLVYTIGEDPYASRYGFVINPAPVRLRKRLERLFGDVQDCSGELAKLRAIKQPEELTMIKKAVALTAEAFTLVKQKLPELRHEYEVEAEFTYHFRRRGAEGHAYEPIVAAGQNACTLHYSTNDDRLRKGSLLLLDVGARVEGYAADVTRTYALGATTKRHAAVHMAVQHAHKEIIGILKPGLSTLEYQEQVDHIMKEALQSLGLIKSLDDEEGYRRYFPHAISHGLGIDVHDSLARPTVFTPGMVLTVEPGIYISEENVGVRIEDDILITETGHNNLSATLSIEM